MFGIKKYIALFLAMLLVGCSTISTESDEGKMQLESKTVSVIEFVNAFNSYEKKLESAKADGESIFNQKLNGVKPDLFLLDGKQVFIYEFKNINKRMFGWEAFQKKTELMNLVSYKKYEVYNLLIFYVHGRDLNEQLDADEIIQNVSMKLTEYGTQ